MTTCKYHEDRGAVARLRWTVYGGAQEHAHVCRHCLSVAYGNRGVDWLCPDCGKPVVAGGINGHGQRTVKCSGNLPEFGYTCDWIAVDARDVKAA
jgi:hypothetical protein